MGYTYGTAKVSPESTAESVRWDDGWRVPRPVDGAAGNSTAQVTRRGAAHPGLESGRSRAASSRVFTNRRLPRRTLLGRHTLRSVPRLCSVPRLLRQAAPRRRRDSTRGISHKV